MNCTVDTAPTAKQTNTRIDHHHHHHHNLFKKKIRANMIPRGNRSVLRRGSDDNSQGSSKQGNQRDGRLHPRHGRAHQNNDLGRASPSGQGRLGFFQQSRREDASNNSSLQAAIPLSREGKNIARQGSPLLTGVGISINKTTMRRPVRASPYNMKADLLCIMHLRRSSQHMY